MLAGVHESMALVAPGLVSVLAQVDTEIGDLSEALGDGGIAGWDWITAGIIFASAIVGSRLVKLLSVRLMNRATNTAIADLVGRLIGYTIVVFGLVYALESLGVQIGPLLGALGIVGIAVAFALRDILENFVAGLLLQFRRPFSYGDQIVSGDTEGTVTAIDARSVTVRTPDGETVYLPSSQVITDAIVNHTEHGRRRTTLEVGVAYGTDLAAAQAAFADAVRSADGVVDSPEPEVLLTGFGDSSIDFVVRFWHAPTIADHWHTRSAVAFAVEAACADHGIEIPFPQRVLWSGIRPGADDADQTPPAGG